MRSWLLLLPTLFGACTAPPLGIGPPTLTLAIDNPHRLPLSLDAVVGDACREVARPGDASAVQLALLAGCYVVRATTARGAFAVPAPLLPGLLPDGVLRLRIAPPPPGADDDREFAFVAAGPAVIGDTLGIGQEDERPARLVDVPAFWLARREVTNAEFAAFLTASEPAVESTWAAFDSKKLRCTRDAHGAWTTDAPDSPVVTVSLAGAEAFCAWRTRTTGVPHRLPGEVEWEKAARGPASFVYAYGNTYRSAAANQESGTLRAVGSFAANGYGLFDMTGNAFEWTRDAYPGAVSPPFQVLRGGSFVLDGMYLRNSFRMKQRPDVRTDDFGFRIARDAADTRSPDR